MSENIDAIKPVTMYQVTGITCLDCAAKFEKAVAALPGVISVNLNTMTGKMVVAGQVDLDVIRQLGREENYTIRLVDDNSIVSDFKKTNLEILRVVISALVLLAAYVMEKMGSHAVLYISLYVSTMILGGWGNFRKAFQALKRASFNMSVLMSIAIGGAVIIGQYEEGAFVAFLYSISEMLEAWTMEKARRSIRDLIKAAPKTAVIRRNGEEVSLPVDNIEVGDLMVIRPGEKLAMDGIVINGKSAVNQAAITGESIPAEKIPGDEVYAGTLNTYGVLEVKVTKLAKDSTIAKIINMVEEAQSKRATSQAFVEKFAAFYTPIVIILAVGIIVIPPLFFDYAWMPWFYRGLSLLVVSCPCALVVSTPVAIVSAISSAARQGVLIKGGIYLEEMATVKAIAFDKTGTLTIGSPVITDILPLSVSEEQLLVIAASLENRSEHPLAAAILKAAKDRSLKLLPVDEFQAIMGSGVQGIVDDQIVYVGNNYYFEQLKISTSKVDRTIKKLQEQGKTVMLIGTNRGVMGLIAVADELRKITPQVINELRHAGIKHTIMLTGDNAATAGAIAYHAGVDEFKAELLPGDKVRALEQVLTKYGKTVMVGDGINDSPALARATVGIAMGGAGTDTALEVADIALMTDDLTKVPYIIRLSRKTFNIIRQNIGFALAIKVIAVLAVFPGWLTLWLAIIADTGATVLVTLNSLRLQGIRHLNAN